MKQPQPGWGRILIADRLWPILWHSGEGCVVIVGDANAEALRHDDGVDAADPGPQ
ncbi:MAG: hypothetical protein KF893_09955 [Caldilineaceae bacterium]|nr:hypothetical protein [Caldilineaceae bacterium]